MGGQLHIKAAGFANDPDIVTHAGISDATKGVQQREI